MVRLYFTQAEMEALSTAHCGTTTCLSPAGLIVSKFDNDVMDFSGSGIQITPSAFGWETALASDITTTGNVYYVEFSTPGFSHFLLHPAGTALPVELVDFDAKANKDFRYVFLNWITASEQNSDFYTVERSMNGTEWEHVEDVDAMGTTTTETTYDLIDPTPYMGTSYYRLKAFDKDGTYKYSTIRTVKLGDYGLTKVYPNPTKGLFNIDFITNIDQQITINVVDQSGRLVHNSTEYIYEGENIITRDLKGLSTGTYTVQVKDSSGENLFRELLFVHQ